MLALVGHGQSVARVSGGLPARGEFRAHAFDRGTALRRGPRRVEPADQQAGDALLLAQQRAARRFRRMRGKDRFDAQLAEQRHDLLERVAAGLQPREALLESAGLRSAAVVHVLATAAHAVHLLREVHDLEPLREGVDQLLRLGGRATLRAHDQLDRLFGFALATPDGRVAVSLDGVEEVLPALVLEHFADELAERVHVVAQCRVLERKEDAFAGHDRGSRAELSGGDQPRRRG